MLACVQMFLDDFFQASLMMGMIALISLVQFSSLSSAFQAISLGFTIFGEIFAYVTVIRPLKKSQGKKTSIEAQRIEATTLHHAGLGAQHTTH